MSARNGLNAKVAVVPEERGRPRPQPPQQADSLGKSLHTASVIAAAGEDARCPERVRLGRGPWCRRANSLRRRLKLPTVRAIEPRANDEC